MSRRSAFTLIELLMVVAMIAVLAAISIPNFLEIQVRAKVARTRMDMAVIDAGLRAYFADHNRYPPNDPNVREALRDWGKTAPPAPIQVSGRGPQGFGRGSAYSEPIPAPAGDAQGYGAMPVMSDPATSASAAVAPPSVPPVQASNKYAEQMTALALSGESLHALTTPVAYFATQLPPDVFTGGNSTSAGGFPANPHTTFRYFNFSDDFPEVTQKPDHALRRYLLFSIGPSKFTEIDRNPRTGPYVQYDPSNGTTSAGELLSFGGRPKPAEWLELDAPPAAQ